MMNNASCKLQYEFNSAALITSYVKDLILKRNTTFSLKIIGTLQRTYKTWYARKVLRSTQQDKIKLGY